MSLMLWNEPFSRLDPFFNQQTKSAISDDGKEISIEIESPGMKPDDVSVSVDRGMLAIKGESKSSRRSRSFSKRYTLPDEIDETGIAALLQDGILTITLPRKELPAARQISVKAA